MLSEEQQLADALVAGDLPYKYVHPECGKVAFYMVERPKPGDVMRSSKVRNLQGDRITPQGPVACGSCGHHFFANSRCVVPTLEE